MMFATFLLLIGVPMGATNPSADRFHRDDISRHLQFDESNRLTSNWLVHSDTDHCERLSQAAWKTVAPSFSQISAVAEDTMSSFFGGSGRDRLGGDACIVIHYNMGTSRKHLLDPLPEDIILLESDDKAAAATYQEFLEIHEKVEVGWMSHLHSNFSLYWINPSTHEREYTASILYGNDNTVWTDSVIGSVFELVDDEKDVLVSKYVIKFNSFFVVGEPSIAHPIQLFDTKNLSASAEEHFSSEWNTSRNIKRTFTELGFAKGELPLDLYGSMSTYYYNNRHSKRREEWETLGGIFVNWWERDVYVIEMPWGLKVYWQSRLKGLVEAWSGVELELTDIYGMRRYEDGARLLTHVDREATHAASLIINVAQGSMRDPWAVEIYDHADRLHEINMNEGDIVYYESARCLHGRMKPLAGEFYVNLFAHYRPIGDPEWFTKKNPKNSVKPLMDIGECSVSTFRARTMATCTGKAKVPYLSPKLQTLKGPDDLYQYWLSTTPLAASSATTATTATATTPSESHKNSEEL